MKKLLLLHGALGSKEQFVELKSLLKSEYTAHDFNFSGHGGKPIDCEFGNKLSAEDILNYLNENKIDRCSIFGYSMGGYAALYFAQKYPERVDKIMTLATKFNWTPTTAKQEVKMLNPDLIEAKVPHFAALLEKRHAPTSWKKILQKTAAMMLALGNGGAFSEKDFASINCETLITVGDSDKMVSITESEKVANFIPKGKLSVLSSVQHPIEKVDKHLLTEAIKEFI